MSPLRPAAATSNSNSNSTATPAPVVQYQMAPPEQSPDPSADRDPLPAYSCALLPESGPSCRVFIKTREDVEALLPGSGSFWEIPLNYVSLGGRPMVLYGRSLGPDGPGGPLKNKTATTLIRYLRFDDRDADPTNWRPRGRYLLLYGDVPFLGVHPATAPPAGPTLEFMNAHRHDRHLFRPPLSETDTAPPRPVWDAVWELLQAQLTLVKQDHTRRPPDVSLSRKFDKMCQTGGGFTM